MLLQVVADLQPERSLAGENGFSVANLRVRAQGQLDEGFGYFLQTNFANSPALLDGRLFYDISERATLHAGAMKTPFSAEFLTSAASIDFVNRSQAVSLLGTGRQIGLTLAGQPTDGLRCVAGLFNGNGVAANGNDGPGVMGVARLAYDSTQSEGRRQLGVSAAHSADDGARVAGAGFSGYRTVLGADGRWEQGRLMSSAEVVWARLDPEAGPAWDPWGYQSTLGWMTSERTQLLARFDAVTTDGDSWSNYVVLGFNLWPTTVTELQVNLLVPTQDAVKHSQLLVNAQVGF